MRGDSADMGMKKRKLYLDSSVLGFAVNRRATDRREEANRLLRQIRDGHFLGGYSFVLETMVGVNAINRRKKLAEVFLCQPSEVILP